MRPVWARWAYTVAFWANLFKKNAEPLIFICKMQIFLTLPHFQPCQILCGGKRLSDIVYKEVESDGGGNCVSNYCLSQHRRDSQWYTHLVVATISPFVLNLLLGYFTTFILISNLQRFKGKEAKIIWSDSMLAFLEINIMLKAGRLPVASRKGWLFDCWPNTKRLKRL